MLQQPDHLRLQANRSPTGRFVSIGLVALFHIFVIYAFATGLANRLVEKLPEDIIAKVEPPKLPDVKPPPPPPPDLVKPPPPFVPPPEIVVQNQTAPVTSITTTSVRPPPTPPAPPKPQGITAPGLVSGGAKCQTSYYPPLAVRLNQEGTTTVAVHVSADGEVTGVDVTNSSGHDDLDQASVKCITNAWHFKPAMQDGQPVASTKQYAIKWQLQ